MAIKHTDEYYQKKYKEKVEYLSYLKGIESNGWINNEGRKLMVRVESEIEDLKNEAITANGLELA